MQKKIDERAKFQWLSLQHWDRTDIALALGVGSEQINIQNMEEPTYRFRELRWPANKKWQ